MNEMNKKVYVGLSGGVDSSVSAYLLKEKEYDVTGVFIKVWHPDFLECDWKTERNDAMRVCAHLDIPFKELDLSEEYKKDVADYMIEEYKRGRTPNPDVMCNKYIKFRGFLDWALKEGADFVATGHYSRVRQFPISNFQLLKGVDENKDQTYFLWTLTQEQLSKIIFPVGELEKSEVRKIAKKAGLFTATKKDSQGICFLGEISIKEFLTKLADPKKGDVLDEDGNIIGVHNGVILYTIGERRGFTITKKTPNDRPYFIVSKDLKANTITVSDKEDEGSLYNGKEIKLENTNWIGGDPNEGRKYQARIRYRQELQLCKLNLCTKCAKPSFAHKGQGQGVGQFLKKEICEWEIVFDNPQKAAATGQSVVVYDEEKCIGGGIISDVKV